MAGWEVGKPGPGGERTDPCGQGWRRRFDPCPRIKTSTVHWVGIIPVAATFPCLQNHTTLGSACCNQVGSGADVHDAEAVLGGALKESPSRLAHRPSAPRRGKIVCPPIAQALPNSSRLTSTHGHQRRERSEPFVVLFQRVGSQGRVPIEGFANAARRVRIPPSPLKLPPHYTTE